VTSWTEHLDEAELGLREATTDLAIAQTQNDYRRVELAIQIAQAHALMAIARKPLG
jgi:hypothetical protein